MPIKKGNATEETMDATNTATVPALRNRCHRTRASGAAAKDPRRNGPHLEESPTSTADPTKLAKAGERLILRRAKASASSTSAATWTPAPKKFCEPSMVCRKMLVLNLGHSQPVAKARQEVPSAIKAATTPQPNPSARRCAVSRVTRNDDSSSSSAFRPDAVLANQDSAAVQTTITNRP